MKQQVDISGGSSFSNTRLKQEYLAMNIPSSALILPSNVITTRTGWGGVLHSVLFLFYKVS